MIQIPSSLIILPFGTGPPSQRAPGGEASCVSQWPVDPAYTLCSGQNEPGDVWGMCCSDLADRAEHLDGAPGPPYGGGRDVKSGAHQPLKPGEFLQLLSLLYMVSLLLVLQNIALCRSDLCSSRMCPVIWEVGWKLRYRLTGLE